MQKKSKNNTNARQNVRTLSIAKFHVGCGSLGWWVPVHVINIKHALVLKKHEKCQTADLLKVPVFCVKKLNLRAYFTQTVNIYGTRYGNLTCGEKVSNVCFYISTLSKRLIIRSVTISAKLFKINIHTF